MMMSQNRQEEKDRDKAKKDYMINLKMDQSSKSFWSCKKSRLIG